MTFNYAKVYLHFDSYSTGFKSCDPPDISILHYHYNLDLLYVVGWTTLDLLPEIYYVTS